MIQKSHFFFVFNNLFIFRACEGEGQRERERKNIKQAPGKIKHTKIYFLEREREHELGEGQRENLKQTLH